MPGRQDCNREEGKIMKIARDLIQGWRGRSKHSNSVGLVVRKIIRKNKVVSCLLTLPNPTLSVTSCKINRMHRLLEETRINLITKIIQTLETQVQHTIHTHTCTLTILFSLGY